MASQTGFLDLHQDCGPPSLVPSKLGHPNCFVLEGEDDDKYPEGDDQEPEQEGSSQGEPQSPDDGDNYEEGDEQEGPIVIVDDSHEKLPTPPRPESKPFVPEEPAPWMYQHEPGLYLSQGLSVWTFQLS